MSENQWITEALVQFTESPLWVSPVGNFVDEHCCIFSNEPEMSLEYTVVHNKFKELVDSLLTAFVVELGVSMEEAVEALRCSLNMDTTTDDASTERKAAKRLFKEIMNADNFRYFQSMMTRRNLELNVLANAALAAQGLCADESGPSAEAESEPLEDHPPARLKRALDANGDVDEEEALQRALAVSLQDSSAKEQLLAYNEACVQEEVNLEVAVAEMEANHAKVKLEEDIQMDAPKDPSAVEQYQQKIELIEKEKEAHIQQILTVATMKKEQVAQPDALHRPEQLPVKEVPVAVVASSTPSVTPAVAPSVTTAVVPTAAPIAAPKALPAVAAISGKTALPSIGQRHDALPSIRSTGTPTPAPKATSTIPASATSHLNSAVATTSTLSKEEMETRAEYMRKQRELILARNRVSRQQQLDSYVENAAAAGSAAPSNGEGATATGGQAVMVEIARRLRGDLVSETRKTNH